MEGDLEAVLMLVCCRDGLLSQRYVNIVLFVIRGHGRSGGMRRKFLVVQGGLQGHILCRDYRRLGSASSYQHQSVASCTPGLMRPILVVFQGATLRHKPSPR